MMSIRATIDHRDPIPIRSKVTIKKGDRRGSRRLYKVILVETPEP